VSCSQGGNPVIELPTTSYLGSLPLHLYEMATNQPCGFCPLHSTFGQTVHARGRARRKTVPSLLLPPSSVLP